MITTGFPLTSQHKPALARQLRRVGNVRLLQLKDPVLIALTIWSLMTAVSGCTQYHAKPLATKRSLLTRVPHLTINADQMPLKELAAHPFNPDDGLDITEVAILAIVNNPGLRSVRDGRGIARSQVMAAGVLANPQNN